MAEGRLTDLWLWLCRESSDMLQKYFYEERARWRSNRYKNSQIFLYFSFIHQLKKNEVWLLTQSGPRPLPVNIASKSEHCSEKLNGNVNINICFHALQVSRYPQTHIDLELRSICCSFLDVFFASSSGQTIRLNKGLPYNYFSVKFITRGMFIQSISLGPS